MIHLSREYKKILYKHYNIAQDFKPPIKDIISMILSYDYRRNDIQETILFLELMHDLLVKNLES